MHKPGNAAGAGFVAQQCARNSCSAKEIKNYFAIMFSPCSRRVVPLFLFFTMGNLK